MEQIQHIDEKVVMFRTHDDVVRGVYNITDEHRETDDGTAFPRFTGERWVFDFEDVPENVRTKYNDKLLPEEYCSWGQNPVRYTFNKQGDIL